MVGASPASGDGASLCGKNDDRPTDARQHAQAALVQGCSILLPMFRKTKQSLASELVHFKRSCSMALKRLSHEGDSVDTDLLLGDGRLATRAPATRHLSP